VEKATHPVLIVGIVAAIAIVTMLYTGTENSMPMQTITGQAIATVEYEITLTQLPSQLIGPALITAETNTYSTRNLQFIVNGEPYGPALQQIPFRTLIDSSQFSPGTHTIAATAITSEGNTVYAPTYTFTVSR